MDSKSKKSSKILKSIVEKKIRRKKNVDSTTKTSKTRKSTNEQKRKSTNEQKRKSTNRERERETSPTFHDCHRVFLNYANKKYRLYSEISDDLECKNLPKIFDYCKKLGSTPEKVLIQIYRDIIKKERNIV